MTKKDRENIMRRILSRQGERLIKSRRRRALYSILRGSNVDFETDSLDVVEACTVTRDGATAREIDDALTKCECGLSKPR